MENSETEASAVVYSCIGTDEDCYADVISTASLDSIVGDAAIAPGTYDTIRMETCRDDGYTVKIKADIDDVSGSDYYTSSENVLIEGSGTPEYATVFFDGCSRNYDLPTELTISDGDTIELKLFVNTDLIAWIDAGGSDLGGCVTNNAGNALCVGYPDVAPAIGNTTVTTEVYRINESGSDLTAGGRIVLFVNGDDEIIGGITRRLFDHTANDLSVNFDTPIKCISQNSGSDTYILENYGSSRDSFYFRMSAFEREDHSGTMVDAEGTEYTYHAVKVN
ncbi:MAG: hypothetical protein O3A01_04190 [bacterium]|nr:hypothetical protein [bacterium]